MTHGDQEIKVVRSRRRTISIEIGVDAVILVRAPMRVTEKQIQAVVDSHNAWINQKIAQAKERKEAMPTRKFEHGEMFPYQGQHYGLAIEDSNEKYLRFNDGFYLPKHLKPEAKKHLTAWYKERARVVFLERVCYHTAQTGSRAVQIRLNAAKTRWGSCSSKNNLNFNWRLIMAPPEILDYVVVHEIIHLEEHNHSQKFWSKVAKQYPDFKTAARWLKVNGHTLSW